jgi:hypothetical protein
MRIALHPRGMAPRTLNLPEWSAHLLAFFSTLSTFGTAVDITPSELAIEAFYPANTRTAMRLLSEIDPR